MNARNNDRVSEGTLSAVRILRMRGYVHVGTALEPTPFRPLPPPSWKRPTTEAPGHDQQQPSTRRPA